MPTKLSALSRFLPLGIVFSVSLSSLAGGGCAGAEDAAPLDGAAPETRFGCRGIPLACSDLPPKACHDTPGCHLQSICTRAPVPCSQLLQNTCSQQAGCHWQLNCMGGARPCEALGSRVECLQQMGCAWHEDEASCTGQSVPCAAVGPGGCATQRGCYVGGTCLGEAAPCPGRAGLDCERQRGCRLEPTCTGEPLPCVAERSAERCAALPGCQWHGKADALR